MQTSDAVGNLRSTRKFTFTLSESETPHDIVECNVLLGYDHHPQNNHNSSRPNQLLRLQWRPAPRFPTISFLVHLSTSDSQLSKYCVVCEISWCRCQQQLTALSISTALVTKVSVVEQLLHQAVKFAVSGP